MPLSTITARVDERDKKAFDAFCNGIGLNTSSAINLFVKAVLKENRIPFEISPKADPFYNEKNQAYVMKSINELRAGKGTAHELIDCDE